MYVLWAQASSAFTKVLSRFEIASARCNMKGRLSIWILSIDVNLRCSQYLADSLYIISSCRDMKDRVLRCCVLRK